MKLVLFPKKTRGTSVNATINIHYGTGEALLNRGAAARITPQMLMLGTTTRSRKQIDDELAALKSRVTISGSGGTTVASIDTTRANLAAVLKLVADVLGAPAFPDGAFEQIRNSMLAAVEKGRTEPQHLAVNSLNRHL